MASLKELRNRIASVKATQKITKAKQMAGSPKPARGIILYWFIGPYALAADLNEVADPNWTG